MPGPRTTLLTGELCHYKGVIETRSSGPEPILVSRIRRGSFLSLWLSTLRIIRQLEKWVIKSFSSESHNDSSLTWKRESGYYGRIKPQRGVLFKQRMNRLVSKKGAFSLAHVRGPIRRQLGGVQSYLLTNDFDSRSRNGFMIDFNSPGTNWYFQCGFGEVKIFGYYQIIGTVVRNSKKKYSTRSWFLRRDCENNSIPCRNRNRIGWRDWLLFGSKNNRLEWKHLGTGQRKNWLIQIHYETGISRFSRGI